MLDTIFALASGQGKAGVSVIRLSGPRAMEVCNALCVSVPPRVASLRRLSFDGDFLDEAVVIAFPGPGSFTGEDTVEFHVHGSMATVSAVLNVLSQFEGVRQADAGEFTRRALENERLDLTQVEALADLIEAETEAQRRQSLRVLSGAMGAAVDQWRKDLLMAVALIEATIDFADEDVPVDVAPDVQRHLGAAISSMRKELDGASAAEMVRSGFEVAIVGPPNIGKSTFLNALAGRDAAITSAVAGTTRDVIEVKMDVRGLAVTFLDTAGIRETSDEVETIGIERAKDRAVAADLRVFLVGVGEPPVMEPRSDDLVLVAKSDLGKGDFSSVSGHGLNEVIERIANVLSQRVSSAGVVIRERHRRSLQSALGELDLAEQLLNSEEQSEIVAEHMRAAILDLDSLIGRVGVEDVLGKIFSSFCIGK